MLEKTKALVKEQNVRKKNIITECDYVGKSCSCTTLNSNNCKKKQEKNECEQKKSSYQRANI